MNEQNAGTDRAASGSGGARSESATSKSHDAAMHMKDAVLERAERAREEAREQAAQRIRRVATQLKNVGETLGPDDRVASDIADRAGRSVERLATYVSSTDLRGVARDAEDFARRQPVVFFGGAFLVGFALGRFARSSSPQARQVSRSSEGLNMQRDERQRRQTQGPSDQRYRENFDATFAREPLGSREPLGNAVETRPTTEVGPAGASAGAPRQRDRAPESNGGSLRGRGRSA